jgi:hypothetical protein
MDEGRRAIRRRRTKNYKNCCVWAGEGVSVAGGPPLLDNSTGRPGAATAERSRASGRATAIPAAHPSTSALARSPILRRGTVAATGLAARTWDKGHRRSRDVGIASPEPASPLAISHSPSPQPTDWSVRWRMGRAGVGAIPSHYPTNAVGDDTVAV